MPDFDSGSKTALDSSQVIAPADFVWIDFSGDPLRITTFGADVTPASTGDSELDGLLFHAFDGRFLDITNIANSDNGSDTLSIRLSGIVGIDDDLMNDINTNKSLWLGRTVRIWSRIFDDIGINPQGNYIPYYTGYASSVKVIPSKTAQIIQLDVENYQAAFNQASNRSYLSQSLFDSGDTSAAATIASANLGRGGTTTPSGAGGAGGGGGSIGGGDAGRVGLVHVL